MTLIGKRIPLKLSKSSPVFCRFSLIDIWWVANAAEPGALQLHRKKGGRRSADERSVGNEESFNSLKMVLTDGATVFIVN